MKTKTNAAQKKMLRLSPKMMMESTVVTTMAHEIRKSRVMLLACFMIPDIIRPMHAWPMEGKIFKKIEDTKNL